MVARSHLSILKRQIERQLRSGIDDEIACALLVMMKWSHAVSLGGRDLRIVEEMATSHDDVALRALCVRVLGELGSRRKTSVEAIVNASRDEDAFIRIEASSALAGSRSPVAIAALRQRLEDDDELVRHAAAESLFLEGVRRPNWAEVELLLADSSALVRLAGVRCVAKRRGLYPKAQSIDALQRVVESEGDSIVALEAMTTLCLLGVWPYLQDMLNCLVEGDDGEALVCCDLLEDLADDTNADAISASLRRRKSVGPVVSRRFKQLRRYLRRVG